VKSSGVTAMAPSGPVVVTWNVCSAFVTLRAVRVVLSVPGTEGASTLGRLRSTRCAVLPISSR
jgi:hypothetical protein